MEKEIKIINKKIDLILDHLNLVVENDEIKYKENKNLDTINIK